MAHIIKRGDRWQARIRRRGYPQQSKNFRTKAAAERWARDVEGKMDRNAFVGLSREAERVTLGECLTRYLAEVTRKKRNSRPEELKIARIQAHPIAGRMLASLRGHDFAAFRDELDERELAPNTIRLYLAPLSHLFNVAREEWGFEGLANPLASIAKPSTAGTERDRRLHDGELDALQLAEDAPAWLPAVITLAVETAMRRSELAGIRENMVTGAIVRLAQTKNGEIRRVPLSPEALAALNALRGILGSLDAMPRPDAISRAFAGACETTGIEDLRFHDLRHEATSRLFERGLGIQEVAAITGHKTWAMLRRYTHPRAEDLVAKLAKKSPQGAG
jgi:integrase